MDRKPESLTPETFEKWKAFDDAMKVIGLEYKLTCTRRTQEEQDALYAQGRTKPGPIVTWTHQSRHIKGEAFDIVIIKNGKAYWSDITAYHRAGKLGELAGLDWGGRWHKPDYPHFELRRKK